MKEKAKRLFDEAIQKLREANDELCRPEEDVVRSLVCSNSHDAIEKFLRGFLALNAVQADETESIERLYERCRALNRHFEAFDLAGFDCNAHKEESRFHNQPTELSHCFDIADSLDTFLRREKIIA